MLSGCKVIHWGLDLLSLLTEVISSGSQCFVLHSGFLSSHSNRTGCYYLCCKSAWKTDNNSAVFLCTCRRKFPDYKKRDRILTGWMISKLTYALNRESVSLPPYTRNLWQQQSRLKAAVADCATALPKADAQELGSDWPIAIFSGQLSNLQHLDSQNHLGW